MGSVPEDCSGQPNCDSSIAAKKERRVLRRSNLIKAGVPCGLVLLAVVYATAGRTKLGYSEIPNGRGGTNVEAVTYTEEMGFDKARSLKAFQETLYPVLRANCSGCHSTENTTASGA